MDKEEKVETIEGGDSSSDALEYTEQSEEREDTTPDEEEDFRDRKAEEHRIEGGDTEWDKEQEGADLEDSGEEEEKVGKEEKREKTEEEEETEKELTGEDKRLKESFDEFIKYVDEDKEGGGTKYKVKGKFYDLKDLTPLEWKDRQSKADRFEQRMQEVSVKEKTIDERERIAEEGARKSQVIMRKYGGDDPGKGEDLPEILKPHEDDTDLEKSLKEMNANLYQKVGKLESGFEQQDYTAKEQQLYRQLDSLEQEFPMLSKSEVIAVKSMPEYAHVDMRTIAENSHNARVGDDYLDSVFKARPDKLREIEEKAVEKYLEKKPNVRKVSRKKSSTVASGKVSSGKKKTPRTLDEIEAHVDSRGGWDGIIPDDED